MRPLALCLLLAAAPAHAQGEPPVGSQPLAIGDAVKLFDAVCLDHAPRFEGSAAVLAANGFVQSAATGTHFHPRLDLSYSLLPREGRATCSMVFASDEDAGALGLAMAGHSAALAGGDASLGVDPATGATVGPGPAGTEMALLPVGESEGQPYFRATLRAQP